MHRFRRTYEFVKTWAEVESKVKDVQLLLCEKLMTVSKKTFHSRTVDVSKRHNVVWHKGIPYICIGYRSYACIRGKKKKEEAKMKNEELAKMIESIRVNVKHVLIFPEFKVDSKTDKFTRKSVARVLKEKLNTCDVITEERYMFSAQIPELEKLLKYSYLKHQVEYCNQHPYAEPLYKPNIKRRRQRSPKAPEKEGEAKQSMKQNQEDLSKSLFPVAHLKGRWGRIHLVSDKQALPRVIADQGNHQSKCKKYRSNSSSVMEAVDNEETVDATFYLIGETVDGNAIEVSIIDDVEFKRRTFSDAIAFICEKKEHLSLPDVVVNRQEVSNLSDTELISTIAQISFVPENKEEEIETEIVGHSIEGSNLQIVSNENDISFETVEHEGVISQLTPESTISSMNTTQEKVIVQHKENLSDFQVNLNDNLTVLNENGKYVGNFTHIEECSTVVSNQYDSVINEETSTCSVGETISTNNVDLTKSNNKSTGEELFVSIYKDSMKYPVGYNSKEGGQLLSVEQPWICSLGEAPKTTCQQTKQDCDNYSRDNFENFNHVEQIKKTCANEVSPSSSDISDEESSLAGTKFSISIHHNDKICKTITPASSGSRKDDMSNVSDQETNKHIKGSDLAFTNKQSIVCDAEERVKRIAIGGKPALLNKDITHRCSEQLSCTSYTKKLIVSNIIQDDANHNKFSSSPPSQSVCRAHVTAAPFKTGNNKQSDGIELVLTPVSEVSVKSLLPGKNFKQINLVGTKEQMLRNHTQKTIFTQNYNTEQATSSSNAEQLLIHQCKEPVEMQNKLFERKPLTVSVSSARNTSSNSNEVIALKTLKKVSVLRNSRSSLISPNEEIFVEVVSNEIVRQKDELKSVSLGVQTPVKNVMSYKNAKRVSLLKNSGQSLPCSSQNSKIVGDSNVIGSLLSTSSGNIINSAITSNKQSCLLLNEEPLLTNTVKIADSLCGDVSKKYTVHIDESSERESLTVPVVRDSGLTLERVVFSNSLVQHNISPTKNLADSKNISTLTVISDSVNHMSNNSHQFISSEIVAGSRTLKPDKNFEWKCGRSLQDTKNIKHKRQFDAAEEALVSLALEMSNEFDVLCKRRKRVFKERTLSLLKNLLNEQTAATNTESIRLKRSDEKYFLHNGLLYKYL